MKKIDSFKTIALVKNIVDIKKSITPQKIISCLGVCLAVFAFQAAADVKLPRLVSDGLILQRDKPINLWGWADDGEDVSATLGKQTLRTQAKAGRWQLSF